MKYLFFFFFVLFGIQACTQQGKTTTPYSTFEGYAFIMDGKIILQDALVDYPGAILDKISPRNIKREGRKYQGVVYFHTPKHPALPVPYANDPAYFINGKQVSPFDIRSSRPEAYTKITKSTRDTVIDGTRYEGAIHVETDEDFFAGRVALPEIFEKYADLPPEKVRVHLYSPWSPFHAELDISTVIQTHFPIYHLDQNALKSVHIDRIGFAEGEQYVVQITDNRYTQIDFSSKWISSSKARTIFKDPLAVDTACTCYLADSDTKNMNKQAGYGVELSPVPYPNEAVYLKKLSATMGLPTERPKASMGPDSIIVRFIMTRDGMLTKLESLSLDKPGYAAVLAAIKRHSCVWSFGITSGNRVRTKRKMTVFYTKGEKGNIQSLDSLAYRYDDALVTHNSQLATPDTKSVDTAWPHGSMRRH